MQIHLWCTYWHPLVFCWNLTSWTLKYHERWIHSPHCSITSRTAQRSRGSLTKRTHHMCDALIESGATSMVPSLWRLYNSMVPLLTTPFLLSACIFDRQLSYHTCGSVPCPVPTAYVQLGSIPSHESRMAIWCSSSQWSGPFIRPINRPLFLTVYTTFFSSSGFQAV